ncbi:hypothetical protein ABZX30_10590 [Streptomyces sp. NPDC004542]
MLPSLGEEGVQTCVPRDLVAEGAGTSGRPSTRSITYLENSV